MARYLVIPQRQWLCQWQYI